MPISTTARIVVTSVADVASADVLAHALVSEKLAACVTRLPSAKSTYRWNNAVEEASEVVCLIKTQADRVDALLVRLRELHAYEVPEGLVLAVEGGLPDYLAWLEASTR
jgi:periplasmic divalent cation tolerance protein